ncbi:hypothetical protein D3C81_1633380 [compost metagenome]
MAGRFLPAAGQHAGGQAQAQETVDDAPSIEFRLPQQQTGQGQRRVAGEIEGQQGAQAQAPHGQGAVDPLRQPRARQVQVVVPDVPARFAKVAAAVAAAEQVDLQHAVAGRGKSARLRGGHVAAFIQFFRERMHVEDAAARGLARRRQVQQAVALAAAGGQEEG